MDDDSGYDLSDSRSIEGSSSSSSDSRKASKKSKTRSAVSSAGQQMNERGVSELQDQARDATDRITSFKRGGTKRGKGPARLHRNETIMAPRKKKGKMMKMGRRGGR